MITNTKGGDFSATLEIVMVAKLEATQQAGFPAANMIIK